EADLFSAPRWGHVPSSPLPASPQGLPIDPGAPPYLGDESGEAFKQPALDVIRYSSFLDPGDGVTIDVGPGGLGRNSLGTNDGNGHDQNPATGKPYPPNPVLRGDYARALAALRADGARSGAPRG